MWTTNEDGELLMAIPLNNHYIQWDIFVFAHVLIERDNIYLTLFWKLSF